jgi:hypothetical protein
VIPQEKESHHRQYLQGLAALKRAHIWFNMAAGQLEELLQDYQTALVEAPFTARRNTTSEEETPGQQTA